MQRPSPPTGNEIRLGDLGEAEFAQLMHAYLSKVYGKEATALLESVEAGYRGDIMLLNPDPIWGGKIIVELKKYSPDRVVPLIAIHQVVQSMATTGSRHGVIMTTGKFSDAAIDLAQSSDLRLVDGAMLIELLQQQGLNATLT